MAVASRRFQRLALGAAAGVALGGAGLFFAIIGPPNAASRIAAPTDEGRVQGFPKHLDAETPLRLTGTALRTYSSYDFYRIGSYCPHDEPITSPEHVRDLERPKVLVLRMLRNIPGSFFSFSFRRSLRNNDPARQFDAECNAIIDYVTNQPIREGDEFRVEYVPGECVTCSYGDKEPLVVNNPAFARVIWSIYFGEYHLGDEIKRGLVSLVAPGAPPVLASAASAESASQPAEPNADPISNGGVDEPPLGASVDEPQGFGGVDEPPPSLLVDEPPAFTPAAEPSPSFPVDEPPTIAGAERGGQ